VKLHAREPAAAAPTTGAAPRERASGAFMPLVELQRLAGNQAVAAFVQRVPPDPPAGVTIGADALPPGANTANAGTATVARPGGMTGGWTDPGGVTTASGTVGAIDRILLEDLPGNQVQQPRLDSGRELGSGSNFARAAGSGRGPKGRAIALVPRSVREGRAGEVAVVVIFHGIGDPGSTGMRARGDRPEDVGDFQVSQQLEAYLAANPGGRIIALIPIGITIAAGNNASFGGMAVDDFVSQSFGRLGTELPAGSTPGGVILGAHSGGGFQLSAMMQAGSRRAPRHLLGMFGFESFHDADIATWTSFATSRLNQELASLEGLRRTAAAANATDDEVFAQQARWLRDSGFRFAAFGGVRPDGSVSGYARRARMIRTAILQWFADHRTQLQTAIGGRTPLLDQLWANFQSTTFTGGHQQALASATNNLGRALAMLPPTAIGLPAAGGQGTTTGGSTTGGSTTPAAGGEGAGPVTAPRPSDAGAPAGAPTGAAGPSSGGVGLSADEPPHGRNDGAPLEIPQPGVLMAQVANPTAVPATGNAPAPATGGAGAAGGAAAAAQPARRVSPSGTPLEHYAMSTREKQVARGVSARVVDYTAEILRAAGEDPVQWYNGFVSNVSFLGRSFQQPIHQTLETHLRAVEPTIQAAVTPQGAAVVTPAEAGRLLDITEDHIGARSYPTSAAVSMHLFGLATDINYTANPFISGSANAIFTRAGQLINGAGGQFRDGMSYDELAALDRALERYFALLDDATALQTRLTAATAAPWHGMTPQAASAQIRADLASVATRWERSEPAQTRIIRAGGFMNHHRELVTNIDMSWGASYGDVMHFDLRTDGGVGQRIQSAIRGYLTRQRAAGGG
jgi:hypothetical protein